MPGACAGSTSCRGPIDPAYDAAPVPRHPRRSSRRSATNGAFLGPSLRRLDVDATVRLFEEAGVATKIEGNGKVFPASDRATDVLDALLRRLDRSGASLRCLSPVAGDRADPPAAEGFAGFAVRLPDSTITARRVIVTVGGRSYPGCGTTGDGYEIARRFGHTIVEPRPALVPLRVAADWVTDLKGTHACPTSCASIHAGWTAPARTARGGPLRPLRPDRSGDPRCQPSRGAVRRPRAARPCGSTWSPTVSREELDRTLQASSRQGRRPLVALLPESSSRAGWPNACSAAAGIPRDRMGPDLSRDERHRLVAALKGLSLPIRGTLGFEKAEVTSGGVSLDRGRPQDAREPAGPRPALRGRGPRPRRPDRRLQLPGRLEHRLARRRDGGASGERIGIGCAELAVGCRSSSTRPRQPDRVELRISP